MPWLLLFTLSVFAQAYAETTPPCPYFLEGDLLKTTELASLKDTPNKMVLSALKFLENHSGRVIYSNSNLRLAFETVAEKLLARNDIPPVWSDGEDFDYVGFGLSWRWLSHHALGRNISFANPSETNQTLSELWERWPAVATLDLAQGELDFLQDFGNGNLDLMAQTLVNISGHYFYKRDALTTQMQIIANKILPNFYAAKLVADLPVFKVTEAQKLRTLVLNKPILGQNSECVIRFASAWKLLTQALESQPAATHLDQAQIHQTIRLLRERSGWAPRASSYPILSREQFVKLGDFLISAAPYKSIQRPSPRRTFPKVFAKLVAPAQTEEILRQVTELKLLDDDLAKALRVENQTATSATIRLSKAWDLLVSTLNPTTDSREHFDELIEAFALAVKRLSFVEPQAMPLAEVALGLSPAAEHQLNQLNFSPARRMDLLKTWDGQRIKDDILSFKSGNPGVLLLDVESKRVGFAEIKDNVVLRLDFNFPGAEARYFAQDAERESKVATIVNFKGEKFEVPARIVRKLEVLYDVRGDQIKSLSFVYKGRKHLELRTLDGIRLRFTYAVPHQDFFNIIYEVEAISPPSPTHQ